MGGVDLVVRGGRLFYRGALVEGGVALDEGRLPRAEEEIDVGGRIIAPGLVDCHAHLRGLRLKHKEDFRTGSLAAAAGGFCTVLDMPNTEPFTDTLARMLEKAEEARPNIYVNVGFYLGLSKRTSYAALPLSVGLKAYMYSPRREIVASPEMVRRGMERVNGRYPLVVHAEEKGLIEELERRYAGKVHSPLERFHLCHPVEAEVRAVSEVIASKPTGCHIHFAHISTAPAARRVARHRGLGFTMEVTPHHLLLTPSEGAAKGPLALTAPPLREKAHVRALIQMVNSGLVDAVASDHAPHTLEEKTGENPLPGIAGLETALPLLLTAVKGGLLNLYAVLRLLTEGPATVFNLRNRGRLNAGNAADITVIDLKREWRIDASKFHSKAKHSPFDGKPVVGGPWLTVVGGEIIVMQGEVMAQPGVGVVLRSGGTPAEAHKPI